MRGDLDHYGAVMTHTYYGRGIRPSNEEILDNVKAAFAFAKSVSDEVYFITDGEDVGFAPKADHIKVEADLLSDPDALMFDKSIVNENHALLVYWEYYGFASDTPDDWRLREEIANVAGIDPRHLQQPQ
jgi:hypothetical protein